MEQADLEFTYGLAKVSKHPWDEGEIFGSPTLGMIDPKCRLEEAEFPEGGGKVCMYSSE